MRPDRFKSNGLDGGAADAVAALGTLALLIAAALIAAPRRAAPDARRLVLAALAITLAFVALGKVLSPQYVIWLLPFAALAAGPRRARWRPRWSRRPSLTTQL